MPSYESRARFGPLGPFAPMLAGDEIEGARVVRYLWLAYGGWGLRYGRQDGRTTRAYSTLFLGSGVVTDTVGGRRYDLPSRRPEELAAAANRLAEEARRA